MEYMAKNIPLWQITTWDKNFNNVDKEWQPKTIKYKYLLSDELDSLRVDDGDIRILYTGKDVGYTTEELAGDNISEGEVVSIPWGGIPTVKYHKGKFVTGDNRIATSNDTSKLTNKYLYYYLQGNIGEIASYYRGASLKHPCMKDVLKMTISYPSVQEQEKICSQFDMLEWLIEARKQELQLLDDLIKARFVEMFGSPVSNPMSWEKRTLKEVCIKLNDGSHFSPESFETGDYKYVTAKNIKFSGFDFSNITYVPEAVHRPIFDRCNPEFEDVLYIKDGATTGVAIVNTLDEEFTLLSSVALLKQDRSIMNGYFLATLLNNKDMYLNIRNNMGGAAITRLTIAKLNAIEIIVPPIELQNQFAAFVAEVDKSKVAVQKALDETQTLFDSLMQEYFG